MIKHSVVGAIFLWTAFSCSTSSISITQLAHEGDFLNNQNQYSQAIERYELFLERSESLGIYRDFKLETEVMRKGASAYASLGKYDQAKGLISRALGIDSTLSGQELPLIEDYRMLGLINGYQQNYIECLSTLETALLKSKTFVSSSKSVNQESLAHTYLSLGQAHLALGNYKNSMEYTKRALTIYKKLSDGEFGEMEALLVIGTLHRDMGELDIALEKINASKLLAEKLNLNKALQLIATAEIHSIRGEFEKSIELRVAAVDEAKQSNLKPLLMLSFVRLGDLYRTIGNDDKANLYYNEALKVQLEMTDKSTSDLSGKSNSKFSFLLNSNSSSLIGSAVANLRLGDLFLSQSNLDSAFNRFEKALKSFDEAGNNEGKAKASIALSDVFFSRKDWSKTLTHLESAQKLTLQPDLKWKILHRKGKLLEAQGRISDAMNYYGQSIDIIRVLRHNITFDDIKSSFGNSIVEVYDSQINLLLSNLDSWGLKEKNNAINQAFNLNEEARSRSFIDMLGNKKITAKNIADTALINKDQLLRLRMSQLADEIDRTQLGSDYKRELINQFERTQVEYDLNLTKLKLLNSNYANLITADIPSIPDIQKQLEKGTSIVEYWVSQNATYAWIISGDTYELVKLEVDSKKLTELISASRRLISLKLSESEKYLTSLADYLIKPIEITLKDSDKLIIIPHRNLHFLPFQALMLEGDYLIQRWTLSHAPSSSVLIHCKEKQSNEGSHLFAVGLGGLSLEGTPPLEGTLNEIEVISNLYHENEIHLEEDFLETAFKKKANSSNYIHIATHGIFNKYKPLFSYLLMGESNQDDGHLTVDEIFDLNIGSKLVTLSACETGLGVLNEGDDLVGLSRAFIYAGAPSVVVSLWSVDDQATALLMTNFNKNLRGGLTASEAISLAQRSYLSKYDLDDKRRNPYYWAPFVLIGNGEIN